MKATHSIHTHSQVARKANRTACPVFSESQKLLAAYGTQRTYEESTGVQYNQTCMGPVDSTKFLNPNLHRGRLNSFGTT